MRVDGIRGAAAAVGVLVATAGVAAPAAGQEWTAQEIVDRAVARADEQRQAGARYRATFEALTERLNGDGEVEGTERATYEQYPLEGVIYEELVAREGAARSTAGGPDESVSFLTYRTPAPAAPSASCPAAPAASVPVTGASPYTARKAIRIRPQRLSDFRLGPEVVQPFHVFLSRNPPRNRRRPRGRAFPSDEGQHVLGDGPVGRYTGDFVGSR